MLLAWLNDRMFDPVFTQPLMESVNDYTVS